MIERGIILLDTDITELERRAPHVREIQHQWSEELTLAGLHAGRSWVAGVFLFGEQDRQATTVWLGGPRLVNSLDPEVRSRSGDVWDRQEPLSLPTAAPVP